MASMNTLSNGATQPEDKTLQLKNTAKRDHLIKHEKRMQSIWESSKLFEVNAPLDEINESGGDVDAVRAKIPKHFVNFPYPYMNGFLHLGHAFTLSKCEFAAAYERLKGKRVLFPLAFHCTGMPIRACADLLKNEIEMFGKDFEIPDLEELEVNEPKPAEVSDKDPTQFKAKKSKANAKKVAMKYQFQIMQASGVPTEIIHEFAETEKWLEYYPENCQADCSFIGFGIDWRRSFITTDKNPYYDSFVRWQVNKLHDLGKIKFGERYTIYSPKDDQPCMDHDRKEGEGVGPQEYTAIKMKVVEFAPEAKNVLTKHIGKEQDVFMVAATLRPETMYGQTNCFVGPNIDYGLYESNDEKALFLCTERAARNMAYQKLSPARGVIKKVASVKGKDLIGTLISAPLSFHKTVYVLPMESVLEKKGTGVVTSVPSDSPDDYANYHELKKKAQYYGIDRSWLDRDIINVIETPAFGENTAQEVCKSLNIQSPKDSALLAQAKEIAYKEGYYKGKMLVGNFKGEKVEDAKVKVRDELLAANEAFVYSEPENKVLSRSNDECCVALCDQWYLDYGEHEWKSRAFALLDQMNTFGQDARNSFVKTLDWLNQWACARSYGLGTRLPWDPQFLVESLSDSTIYMAYYTIAHYLQGDRTGSKVGIANIKPEQMTAEVWDYVFCLSDDIPKTDISEEFLSKMRQEFQYFYPFDMRASGKDLIPNHLTFSIYTHAAVFDQKYWPQGMRANGHLLLNGEKMSKSLGNFITLRQACEKYGSDAVRLALADAGDGIEDANFEESVANSAILRLYTLEEWIQEQMADLSKLRTGSFNFHDLAFENEINKLISATDAAYGQTYFKEALKNGFYEFLIARDWYREVIASSNTTMHKELVQRWIEVQCLLLAPVASHWSDHIWLDLLKKPESIHKSRFPVPSKEYNSSLGDALTYIKGLGRRVHMAEGLQAKKQKKGKGVQFDPRLPKSLTIYYASAFPTWQKPLLELIDQHSDHEARAVNDKELMRAASKGPNAKKASLFIRQVLNEIDRRSQDESIKQILNRDLTFNEKDAISEATEFLKQSCGIAQLTIIEVPQPDEAESPYAQASEPGNPSLYLTNIEQA